MEAIIPYFNFNGNARAAMHFYQSCLGGTLSMMNISEAPFAGQMPEDLQDKVLYATLTADNITIMASDMIAGNNLHEGNNVSVMIACSSCEEIERLYDKLRDGGAIRDELKLQFWGDIFGAVTDKFGINWALNFGSDKNAE